MTLLVVGVLVLGWLLVCDSVTKYCRENSREISEAVERDLVVGKEAIFAGSYIAHWEVSRFEWYPLGTPVVASGFNARLTFVLDIPTEVGWLWLTEAISESE